MPSSFRCSPVIRECSWKKSQIEKNNNNNKNTKTQIWDKHQMQQKSIYNLKRQNKNIENQKSKEKMNNNDWTNKQYSDIIIQNNLVQHKIVIWYNIR